MVVLSQIIKQRLQKAFGIKDLDFSVSVPERQEFGDYSTNLAFVLAKQKQTSPFLIAEDLRKEIIAKRLLEPYCDKTEVKNGYLNFFLSPDFLAKCYSEWEKFIAPIKPGKASQKVIIDFSSPNIGKTLSVAHIRSTILGESLSRIFEYLGWKVIRDNHLGDWGMLAAKLIAAYKKYSKKPLAKVTIEDMQKWYVRFTTEEKTDSNLTTIAKQETVRLQQGEPKSVRTWKALRQSSLKEFHRLYKRLDVRFDYEYGESHYHQLSQQLIKKFIRQGLAQRSQGAVIISLDEFSLPPILIQKSDDASLYATNDFATAVFRYKKWKPDLSLYVVANEQALYFEQLFRAFEKHHLSPKTKLVHVKFGMLRGADGKKLSTRRGAFISLEELIDKAIQRASQIAKKKNLSLTAKELEQVALTVGLGALKYQDLSQNRQTDIIFDWDKMMSLQGNSAPYLQYTYARFMSILAKSLKAARQYQVSNALGTEEQKLMRKCVQLNEAVCLASQEYMPNLIANYIYELCSLANAYYEKIPVLKCSEPERSMRLGLIKNIALTIKLSLGLLGISVMKKM